MLLISARLLASECILIPGSSASVPPVVAACSSYVATIPSSYDGAGCGMRSQAYPAGMVYCGVSAVRAQGVCYEVFTPPPTGWTLGPAWGRYVYSSIWIDDVCGAPEACPNTSAQEAAVKPRVISGLSADGAKGVARDAARGQAATCVAGCIVENPDPVCAGLAGVWTCTFSEGRATGSPCDGSGGGINTPSGFEPKTYDSAGTYADNPRPDPPPKGKCPGTVNGVTVYVNCDSSVTVTATSTTSTSGSSTRTFDGTKETTCTGGTCTSTVTGTTTITTGGSGSGGAGVTSTSAPTSSTTADPQDDYCTRFPDGPLCKSSRFGGSCNSQFTCDGDASLCATAKAANRTACAFSVDATANAALAAATASVSALTGTVIDLGPSSFDSSDALGGGGQCIQDLTVTVWSKSVTLPLSQICPQLEVIGQILVAVSFLLAIRIVSRG